MNALRRFGDHETAQRKARIARTMAYKHIDRLMTARRTNTYRITKLHWWMPERKRRIELNAKLLGELREYCDIAQRITDTIDPF